MLTISSTASQVAEFYRNTGEEANLMIMNYKTYRIMLRLCSREYIFNEKDISDHIPKIYTIPVVCDRKVKDGEIILVNTNDYIK